MGFVSNQWLNRGQGVRNRKYQPVVVTINAEVPTDSWSRNHNVSVEFTARQKNSEYQTMHLTQEELESATMTLISVCPRLKRIRLVLELLRGLPDTTLLHVLAHDLKTRTTKKTTKR